MHKLSYNTSNQRTSNNNYWLGAMDYNGEKGIFKNAAII